MLECNYDLFDSMTYRSSLSMDFAKRLTAGVTGKGGIWRTKPPDAESAVGARIPERRVFHNSEKCIFYAIFLVSLDFVTQTKYYEVRRSAQTVQTGSIGLQNGSVRGKTVA